MSNYWNKKKKYWMLRLKKLGGSPSSIALGVACGVSVSFTPFVGAHLVLAMVLAWCLRANVVASVLGTAFGNPWTFPFIWFSVLYTGRKMLGEGYEGIADVNFKLIFSDAFSALIDFDFELLVRDIWPILYPMIVGCLPYCLVFFILTYRLVKAILVKRNNVISSRI